MMRRLIQSFSPRSLPLMTRPSYHHEMVNACTFPVALSLVEGAVVSTLALKAFGLTHMQYATLMSAPMFANLTSFLWSAFARNRRKVRLLVAIQAALAICVGAIGFLPDNEMTVWYLMLLVVQSRCLQAGIVTIRSVVWRMNYPRHLRAQITGQLVTVNAIIMSLAPLAASALLDIDRHYFGWIYGGSMFVAMVGVLSFSRIRLRHEKQLLQYEKSPSLAELQKINGQGSGPDSEGGDHTANGQPEMRATVMSVLRDDRHFRWYLVWQYLGGMANMMGEVVLVHIIADVLTADMKKGEYTVSMLFNSTVPMVMMILSMQVWARYMDRVHIVQFRSRQSVFWVVNQSMNWIGVALGSLPFLFFQRIGQGISRGGGTLAWHLGHNDFAARHAASVYMGIHVTLTGVRGLTAPFIGMALYEDAGFGVHVFLVTTALAILSLIGYARLNQVIQREQSALSE